MGSNNRKEFWELVLASCFHDIGKIIRIAQKENRSHPILTSYFFSEKEGNPITPHIKKLNLNPNRIKDISSHHHENPRMPEEAQVKSLKNKRDRLLSYILSRSDNISSAERSEDKENTDFPLLHNIIERVGNKDTIPKNVFLPSALFENVEMKTESKVHSANWRKIYDGLVENIKKIQIYDSKNLEHVRWSYFVTLDSIFKNWLWSIPSDTTLKIRDVSLYDHLKTTTAIAGCLYEYLEAKGSELTKKALENALENKPLLLVAGDFSGIQNYIFNIAGEPGVSSVAKRLRARSFLVHATTTSAAVDILFKLGLPISNLLFNYAGKFILLAPNNDRTKKVLKDIQISYEKFFIENTLANQKIVFALLPINTKDLRRKHYGKTLYKLNKKLVAKKLNPFDATLTSKEGWNAKTFDFSFAKNLNELCKVCETRKPTYKSDDNQECSRCSREKTLGKKLPNGGFFVLTTKKKSDFQLTANVFGAHKNKVSKINENVLLILNLDSPKKIFSNKRLSPSMYIQPTGFHVPKLTDKDIKKIEKANELSLKQGEDKTLYPGNAKTFYHMALLATGDNKIGILKLDIDKLGFLVSRKVPDQSVTRFNTFAAMLDLFFTSRVNKILSDEKLDNIYIVFSGGDDMFCVGAWSEIFYLLNKLKDEFSDWCNNESITFSSSLLISNARYPVYAFATKAEAELTKAKIKRNEFSLLDTTVKPNQFEQIWKYAKLLANEVNKQNISRSLLQKLIDIYFEWEESQNEKTLPIYAAHLAYNLKRNIYDNGECLVPKELEEFLISFTSISQSKESFFKIGISSKLALLLTRNREEI